MCDSRECVGLEVLTRLWVVRPCLRSPTIVMFIRGRLGGAFKVDEDDDAASFVASPTTSPPTPSSASVSGSA